MTLPSGRLSDYIFSSSAGDRSAQKRLSFVRGLVRAITDTENYDDLDFLVTRFEDVRAFLLSKSLVTRNRYATHILGVFDLVRITDTDEATVRRCRGQYRLIVSATKRVLRTKNKTDDSVTVTETASMEHDWSETDTSHDRVRRSKLDPTIDVKATVTTNVVADAEIKSPPELPDRDVPVYVDSRCFFPM